MTTRRNPPPQPPEEAPKPPNGVKDVLLSAIPPLKAAGKVLKARDPLKALAQEKHSWYGGIVALALIMLVAMAVMLSADFGPPVDPFASLWTYQFKLLVKPTYNWPALLEAGGYALAAIAIACVAYLIAGRSLSDGMPATRGAATRLAGYGAIGAAFAFLTLLLLIDMLGWLLYLLKFRIFVFGWMAIASVVFLPFTT